MILTGKCKEKFLEWYWNEWFEDKERNHYEEKEIAVKALYTTDKLFLNALIVEWFDSAGIYINVFYKYIWRVEIRDSQSSLLSTLDYAVFESRQEATIQAIKKANEIYNERFK